MDALFDPQTSGGLLIALPKTDGETLVHRMVHEGIDSTAIIGEVVKDHKGRIVVA